MFFFLDIMFFFLDIMGLVDFQIVSINILISLFDMNCVTILWDLQSLIMILFELQTIIYKNYHSKIFCLNLSTEKP